MTTAPVLDPAVAARLKRTPDGWSARSCSSTTPARSSWSRGCPTRRSPARSTTREATYWSRSRGELWIKGATSGHTQAVREVRLDCDGDTLLVLVDQEGAACHTGDHTCFDADLLITADGAP